MNDAEEHFRDLLTDAPFDDGYRSEHRDEVRERALRAFDKAAAEGAPATVGLGDSLRRPFTRRRAVRMAVTFAAAASLCGALVAWFERSDDASSSGVSAGRRADAQSDALAIADQRLVAALNLLSDFDVDHADAVFDHGVQACLGEYYSQVASTGERRSGARSP